MTTTKDKDVEIILDKTSKLFDETLNKIKRLTYLIKELTSESDKPF